MQLYICFPKKKQDMSRQKNLIDETKKLIDLGGDWDRRNRLKVKQMNQ